jgi:hypothetical protein
VISITSSWQQQAAQVEHVTAGSEGICVSGMRVSVIDAQCMPLRGARVNGLTEHPALILCGEFIREDVGTSSIVAA